MNLHSSNPPSWTCWPLLKRKWRRRSITLWLCRRRISRRRISGLRKRRARWLRLRATTTFCRIISKSSLNQLWILLRLIQQLSIQLSIPNQCPMSVSIFLSQSISHLPSRPATFLQLSTTAHNTFRPFNKPQSSRLSNKPFKSSQPIFPFSQLKSSPTPVLTSLLRHNLFSQFLSPSASTSRAWETTSLSTSISLTNNQQP